MPLPFAAQLGIAAGPSLIRAGANIFRNNKPTAYERRLSKITKILEQDANSPLTDNRFYKEGRQILDKRTDKSRDSAQNASAATGATDEAKLAATDQINDREQDGTMRLLTGAEDFKRRAQARFLQAMGMQESAKQARNANFRQSLDSIISPLQSASKSFLMSDIFGGEGGTDWMAETPEAPAVGGPAATGSMFNTYSTAGGRV